MDSIESMLRAHALDTFDRSVRAGIPDESLPQLRPAAGNDRGKKARKNNFWWHTPNTGMQ